jgi:hypothetical protein
VSSDFDTIVLLRKKIRSFYVALDKARDLNASEVMLGAIRRKIFEAQDQLVLEAIKQKRDIPQKWYAGK